MTKGVWLIGTSVCLLSGEVRAQTSSAVDSREPAIIVTGERTNRSMQETASSVAVFGAGDIDQRAVDRVEQLLASVPNVQVGSGGDGPTIRGQDSTGVLRDVSAFFGGTRPRVTLQVDGRAVGYYEYVLGFTSTWDVTQVEVFRSPQTTTQGRNSIAGAIFVNTSQPVFNWEGRARVIVGDYKVRQSSLAVSGPLVGDEVALRVVTDVRHMKPSSDMVDGVRGAEIDRDDYWVTRAKLLFEPHAIPGFSLTTTYAHAESQTPQFEAVGMPFEDREYHVIDRTNGVFRINTDSLTALARYRVAPALTWSTTLSRGDAFIRRFGLPGQGEARTDAKDTSAESIITWQPDSPFQVLGGIHVLSTQLRQSIDVSGLGLGTGAFRDEQESLGVFGEATWHPVPALSIAGGLRYQRDWQDRTGRLERPARPVVLAYDRTFAAWLPKLSIAYDLDDDVTAGVLIQRAYNPGGVTIKLLSLTEDDFEAETLWDYESFLRVRLADGRGTFSANLFYNDITNAQRSQRTPFTPPIGRPGFETDIVNAQAAESYGAELELDVRATDRLSVRLGVGLLETEILRATGPTDPNQGKEFQRSPGFSASAAFDWRPLEGLQVSAQLRTNTGYFSDDANTPSLHIDGSTVVNARAAYEHRGFTAFGYVRNLFDKFYMTYLFAPTPVAPTFGTAGDPREFGIGIEARF